MNVIKIKLIKRNIQEKTNLKINKALIGYNYMSIKVLKGVNLAKKQAKNKKTNHYWSFSRNNYYHCKLLKLLS